MHDVFELLLNWCEAYGYPVLVAGVMLENAGLPVPGETAVLIAGFLASETGGHRFNLLVVIVLTVVAAVVGDNLGFWLGRRWARPKLRTGRRFLFLTPRALAVAESYFDRYGSWTIFFARFITGLRVVGALAAGTAGMRWPRFLAANAAGAVTWAVTISSLAYFLGQYLHLLEKWLTRTGLIALGVFVVLVMVAVFVRRRRRLAVEVPDPAAPDLEQGRGQR